MKLSVEQAKRNLREAIIIIIEETKKLGTFDQFLQQAGFEEIQSDVLSARKELVGFQPKV
jgi:hypothetical protein